MPSIAPQGLGSYAHPPVRPHISTAALAAACALPIWLAFLTFPTLQLRDFIDFRSGSDILDLWQRVGLAFFVALTSLYFLHIAYHRQNNLTLDYKSVFIIIAFFFLVSLSALYSLDRSRSLSYAALIAMILIGSTLFWNTPSHERQVSYAGSAAVLVAVILAGLVMYGGIHNRWIGGIHPNWAGQWGCAIVVLTSLCRRPIQRVGLAAGLLIVLAVSSRGSMLFLLTFCALRYALPSAMRAGAFRLLAGISVLFMLGAVVVLFDLLYGTFSSAVDDVLALSDGARGVGSGATGRLDLWFAGLRVASEYFWTGAGFRIARSEILNSAHSGLVEMIIDFGIWGAVLLIAINAYAVSCMLMSLQCRSRVIPLEHDPRLLFGSFFISYTVLAAFEPIYFGLGNPICVVALLVLAVPTNTAQI